MGPPHGAARSGPTAPRRRCRPPLRQGWTLPPGHPRRTEQPGRRDPDACAPPITRNAITATGPDATTGPATTGAPASPTAPRPTAANTASASPGVTCKRPVISDNATPAAQSATIRAATSGATAVALVRTAGVDEAAGTAGLSV